LAIILSDLFLFEVFFENNSFMTQHLFHVNCTFGVRHDGKITTIDKLNRKSTESKTDDENSETLDMENFDTFIASL